MASLIIGSSETLWGIPDWFLCWNQPLLGVWLVEGQWKKDGKKHFWGFRRSDFSLPFFAHNANWLKAWERFILAWKTPITRWISLPSNIYLNNKNAPQRGAWVNLDLSRVDLMSFRVEGLRERSELWGFRPRSSVVKVVKRPREQDQGLFWKSRVTFDLKKSCIFNSNISVTCITCVRIDLDMKMIALVRVGITDEIPPWVRA